ncbi:hypothetical protein [Geothrix sp. 21YS21S-2]|uniref:hypothetical protein n=1 Tax=Geothrix sp. 21YS21S-2 TaxID=3068893 RepID=UPI0027BA92EF|nr:hypothetical protein [Geothrix sp. 21YS21S-2]
MSNLPPNTFDLTIRVTVTLPPGEDPETQDVPMLITGGDFNPWPGVQIHDAEILAYRPREASADIQERTLETQSPS